MNDILKEKFKQALRENADHGSDGLSKQKLPNSIFIIPGVVFILILLLTFLINPYSTNDGPVGQIKQPSSGTQTAGLIKIVGETRNIQQGQYIWLAVDKPNIGLCWPKQSISPNSEFMTEILEEGPKGPFTLSIYVLSENFHNQWKEWQDRKIFGGLHIPPDSKRIASVNLILKTEF